LAGVVEAIGILNIKKPRLPVAINHNWSEVYMSNGSGSSTHANQETGKGKYAILLSFINVSIGILVWLWLHYFFNPSIPYFDCGSKFLN
jgi:hypothetical protein